MKKKITFNITLIMEIDKLTNGELVASFNEFCDKIETNLTIGNKEEGATMANSGETSITSSSGMVKREFGLTRGGDFKCFSKENNGTLLE